MPGGSYVKTMPWGQQKPPVGFGIDWSHPLARDLTSYFLINTNSQSFFDVVTLDLSTAINEPNYGSGYIETTSTGTKYYASYNTKWPTGNNITIFGQFSRTNKYSAQCIFGRYSSNSNSVAVQWPYNEYNFAINIPGIGRSKSGLVPITGGLNNYACVISQRSNQTRFQLNGRCSAAKYQANSGTGDGVLFGASYYGGALGAEGVLNGRIHTVGLYARDLADAELLQLYEQPYCMIEGWNYGRVYSIPSSAFINSSYWYQNSILEAI